MALPWQRRDPRIDGTPARRRNRRRDRPSTEEIRQRSARLQEERRRQRLAITIGTMLILVVFAIVAVGLYREFYEPPRVTAGEVRGVKFTMGDLVERIRVLQGINRYEQGGFVDLSVVPFQYLQDLLNAEILRQAAPGLGFTATKEQVDEEIRRRFYPDPPAGQEADTEQLDREFENNYSNLLTQVRLSDEAYRKLVEEDLLESQLGQMILGTIPAKPEQVEVDWIRLDYGGAVEPDEVKARLDGGDDFGAVAREVGVPQGFADEQGHVGWVPQGAFPNLDEVLFGDPENAVEPLPVGAISEPKFAQDGIYIINKLSGPEEREAEFPMLRQLVSEGVAAWKNDQLTRGSSEGWLTINFDSERYAWVADQVRLTAPRVDRTQPDNQGGLPSGGR
ncbi:MAG TPA: SurA N-terminal domain-containing protein [Dehalococcoidia bacterium]|nr:SurA N-terminal domain-containing protein [Dehalococcoidia bacterium]